MERITRPTLLLERFVIAALVGTYLVIFNRDLPHGDAMLIVAQIRSDNLVFNPNNLLAYPIGFYWFMVLQSLGFGISELDSFEVISGVSTIISLLIYHQILVEVKVTSVLLRLFLVLGLFASNKFLSQAISQYFFMLMMPLLMAALLLTVRFFRSEAAGQYKPKYLYLIGVLTAIPATLKFNSVLLPILIGMFMAWTGYGEPRWKWRRSLAVWLPAGIVGVGVFFFVYALSGSESGFFQWLLSAGGRPDSTLKAHYATDFTVIGILTAVARAGFHFFIGAFVETGELSTLVRSFFSGGSLQYTPSWLSLLLSSLLACLTAFGVLWVLVKSAIAVRVSAFVRILGAWIVSYILFILYWGTGGDAFWFQILPPIWLLAILFLGVGEWPDSKGAKGLGLRLGMTRLIPYTVAIVILLLVVNTVQTAVPVSFSKFEDRKLEFANLTRNCDLLISPGWDHLEWIEEKGCNDGAERLLLMNMMLMPTTDPTHISNLRKIVGQHIEEGKVVLVARLYDFDSTAVPWYRMNRAGWSRERILKMLGEFCTTEVGNVGDVAVRRVHLCST